MNHHRIAIRLFTAAGLLLLAGCDPCFGTNACIDPVINAEGRLIWLVDGSAAAGVLVEFRPDPNSSVTEMLSGVSNGDGLFRLTAPAREAGQLTGTLVFHPPDPYPQFVFSVPGVRVYTTQVRGDPTHVGNWGVGPVRTEPHISYVGELFFGDSGERAADVEVEFRRTGGIAVRPDTFTVRSNAQGRVPFFMEPVGEGEVEGEIEVRPPDPYQPLTVTGLRMQTLIGKDDIRLIGVWSIER
jgi:hypothetical protein